MNFTLHTPTQAPTAALALLEGVQKAYGFVPNLMGQMAEAPAALQGYLALGQAFGQSSLSAVERQVVMMTINRLADCGYCMAAHCVVASMEGMPAEVLSALRAGRALPDTRLDALRQFTERMHNSRGHSSAQDLAALLTAGYSRQTALEVITGVGLKLISNYAAHLMQPPLDAAFQAQAW
ncbi:AhpD family alkylhydroperoxidase [Inhella inkyongensis]|uniref:AhpD family alkylhydroperoxidase n=1 Tax=Inhella inkyongensis TaxID=392593 RepID=A0A840SDB1_9BURK|nr:carboxymuconolactone decarboxylase family protein [Inhella inkyongensis]MBB5206330.1 AhpD family alkylhydroperoxidase [Inhella inkyongensis]